VVDHHHHGHLHGTASRLLCIIVCKVWDSRWLPRSSVRSIVLGTWSAIMPLLSAKKCSNEHNKDQELWTENTDEMRECWPAVDGGGDLDTFAWRMQIVAQESWGNLTMASDLEGIPTTSTKGKIPW
jgi:hypothetical protein